MRENVVPALWVAGVGTRKWLAAAGLTVTEAEPDLELTVSVAVIELGPAAE